MRSATSQTRSITMGRLEAGDACVCVCVWQKVCVKEHKENVAQRCVCVMHPRA